MSSSARGSATWWTSLLAKISEPPGREVSTITINSEIRDLNTHEVIYPLPTNTAEKTSN
ncbi:hypothetical protein [Ectopseudomonas oleovorans]|uniref:hypothetical protein n=1 Tax=Ectopseudomonas oleovorans TaxID=301 RepID=UPI002449EC0E|nr:hypothetical protein [Pseudomonas oleovorans]MDH2201662.1 hypothetical protein [Pseudomonas oleovorans]